MSAVLRDADSEVASLLLKARAILAEVTYKPGWTLDTDIDGRGEAYMVWRWRAPDASGHYGGTMAVSGRRWFISPYMSRSELVNTALLAALTAEEHETREFFRYKGKRVFNPHVNVERLFEVCEDEDNRNV